MKKIVLILICIMFMPAVTLAASGYQGEINKFFKLFEAGKKSEAVNSIYRTNPWMDSAQDAIINIKNQLQSLDKLVGNYNGKEKVGELDVRGRFVHITYLALYDRQPVRMEFQFYRPKDEWIIYSFSFDVKFDDEVEAMARKNILKK